MAQLLHLAAEGASHENATRILLEKADCVPKDEATFVHFLQPIADLELRVVAVRSDKQRGLEAAEPRAFPHAKHAFCQRK